MNLSKLFFLDRYLIIKFQNIFMYSLVDYIGSLIFEYLSKNFIISSG